VVVVVRADLMELVKPVVMIVQAPLVTVVAAAAAAVVVL
jgi:hypothetical protein